MDIEMITNAVFDDQFEDFCFIQRERMMLRLHQMHLRIKQHQKVQGWDPERYRAEMLGELRDQQDVHVRR